MKKVCVIIPYFGRWPVYFGLFLDGCDRNPDVDILFFTDLEPPARVPGNVTFHPFTLDRVNQAIRTSTCQVSNIKRPFKLCDVRPAYGLLFQKYISSYDFWGWGDIDVVYGNLSPWLSDDVLANDVISFRNRWLSGSLTLVRNTNYLNKLFLQSPDIGKLFASDEYFGFDEISKCWSEIRTKPIRDITFPNDNFTRIVISASEKGDIKVYMNDHARESIAVDDYMLLRNSKLTDSKGNEYPYYHFITEKRKPYFLFPKWRAIPDEYVIDRTGFYTPSQFQKRHIIGMWRKARAVPKLLVHYLERITPNA